MKNDLNAADLKKMFLFTAQKIVDSEPYLTEIDSVIGDGDHGTGMALGFSYVIKELPQKKCESAEDVVSSVGLILIDTMGGASGVLFGTMFISGIVDREKHETLDLCGFAEIFRKSLDALKKRGKAKVGDKTMIDAFEPAVCGLQEAAEISQEDRVPAATTEEAIATVEEAEDTAAATEAAAEEENTAAVAEKESEDTPVEEEAVAVTEGDECLQIAEPQETFPDTEEDRVPVDKDVSVNDDSVQVVETAEEDIFGTEENQAISLETETVPIDEIMEQDHAEAVTEGAVEEEPVDIQSDLNQEGDAEVAVEDEEVAASEDSEIEEEYESSDNQTPFVLDQEQQNLLWCHAKHQIKDSPSFEQYLNTTDPEQLAQLFLYLRDLAAYLPQEELEIFLNSSERIQIYYIIARLSGELGLKEQVTHMTAQEAADLLSTDGMLIKRPLLVRDNQILQIGYRKAYEELGL